jgi:hypothetical protein
MALVQAVPASDDGGGGHPPAVPWTGTTAREVIDMPGWTSRPPTGRRRQPRPRPARRCRAAAVALALLLLATACGGGDGDPAAAPSADPGPAPSSTAQRAVDVEVFFPNVLLGDLCSEVFPVNRAVEADDPVTGALEALLAGPTADERAAGYGGWFTPATADALLHVEVTDGTAHVVFRDLRTIIPSASTSCGSSMLLAMLDTTLLQFDGIDATRYALADQTAFSAWLQLADPDAPDPDQDTEPTEPAPPDEPSQEPRPDEPTDADGSAREPEPEPEPEGPDQPEPTPPDEARPDLDDGWTALTDVWLPVLGGSSGNAYEGPVSPEGAIPADGWPTDGTYAIDLQRTADDLGSVRLTLGRWVACADHPDLPCGDPDGRPADAITVDPAGEVTRTVSISELRAVLFTSCGHIPTAPQPAVISGTAGALATLLVDGIDPAFDAWIRAPFLDGMAPEEIHEAVAAAQGDPSTPFETDACGGPPENAAIRYRGPLGVRVLAAPESVGFAAAVGRWPPGVNGLYDWQPNALEIRNGEPIVFLRVDPLAG